MSTAVTQVLNSFEALSESQKREAVVVILKQVLDYEPGEISDDELVAAADELFLAYDAEEASNAHP